MWVCRSFVFLRCCASVGSDFKYFTHATVYLHRTMYDLIAQHGSALTMGGFGGGWLVDNSTHKRFMSHKWKRKLSRKTINNCSVMIM